MLVRFFFHGRTTTLTSPVRCPPRKRVVTVSPTSIGSPSLVDISCNFYESESSLDVSRAIVWPHHFVACLPSCYLKIQGGCQLSMMNKWRPYILIRAFVGSALAMWLHHNFGKWNQVAPRVSQSRTTHQWLEVDLDAMVLTVDGCQIRIHASRQWDSHIDWQ